MHDKNAIYKNIGNNLKTKRIEMNLSQEEFAELLKMNQSQYSKIENAKKGSGSDKISNLIFFSDVLGIDDINWLMKDNSKDILKVNTNDILMEQKQNGIEITNNMYKLLKCYYPDFTKDKYVIWIEYKMHDHFDAVISEVNVNTTQIPLSEANNDESLLLFGLKDDYDKDIYISKDGKLGKVFPNKLKTNFLPLVFDTYEELIRFCGITIDWFECLTDYSDPNIVIEHASYTYNICGFKTIGNNKPGHFYCIRGEMCQITPLGVKADSKMFNADVCERFTDIVDKNIVHSHNHAGKIIFKGIKSDGQDYFSNLDVAKKLYYYEQDDFDDWSHYEDDPGQESCKIYCSKKLNRYLRKVPVNNCITVYKQTYLFNGYLVALEKDKDGNIDKNVMSEFLRPGFGE